MHDLGRAEQIGPLMQAGLGRKTRLSDSFSRVALAGQLIQAALDRKALMIDSFR